MLRVNTMANAVVHARIILEKEAARYKRVLFVPEDGVVRPVEDTFVFRVGDLASGTWYVLTPQYVSETTE